MKRTLLTLLFSILFITISFCQDKSKFDLNFQNIRSNKSVTMGADHLILSNDKTEFTLLKDGFFTIGTNKGFAAGSLDDSCQITFGHPYAMTSYPYFRINGINKNLGMYFYGQTVNLTRSGDTLILSANEDSHIGFTFYLIAQDNGNTIRGIVKIINKDLAAMDISAGVVLDPALGKWGDGFIFDSGLLIQNNKTYQSAVPHALDIWERGVSPKGMGFSLNFPLELPDRVDINNWFNLHNNQPDIQSLLYDAALNFEKSNSSLAPGDTLNLTFDITLLPPDFPDGLFMRSQLPCFLSIENSILFPSQTTAMTEIYNNSTTSYENLNIKLLGGGLIDDYDLSSSFQLNSGSKTYKNILLNSHEIYENIITPLKLDLTSNSQLQDEIGRNIFIPSSPVSDTGLAVVIDSVNVNFPHIQLSFKATREDNGALLTSLRNENIFLYEDQQRVNSLTLAKDTTGGAGQADIIFVLDVTGSMTENINDVKNNIVEFTDSLSRRGIDFRLGMVTFLDYIENVYNFTSDVQLFQQYIGLQYAHAGDDTPENSLAALLRASQFDFRPSANRVFIWITDADFHIQDQFTTLKIQDVVNELLAKSIVVNCIGDLQYQTGYYDPVVLPTGGNVFDILGNFRDVLMQISRLRTSGKYLLNYNSIGAAGSHQVKLQLHYAGLGGSATVDYASGSGKVVRGENEGVACYPNPFNPSTNIYIKNPGLYKGEVAIFNILGQRVKSFSFDSGQNPVHLRWNASNESDIPVGTGIYFVRVSYFSPGDNGRSLPVQKLIYIK